MENKDIITIYSSYNNKTNSLDYPSMYENVIGSGYKKEIEYKDIDMLYKSNRIIIIPKFNLYSGTSYLSLFTMLNTK